MDTVSIPQHSKLKQDCPKETRQVAIKLSNWLTAAATIFKTQ